MIPDGTANRHLLAGSWLDALVAVFIAGSSLFFVIAGGHGVGILGMWVVGVPFSEAFEILFTPWGLHLWIGIGLLLSALLPISVRLVSRCLAVAASLGVVGWFYSFSEWPLAFLVSALPNMLTCMFLAVATFVVHHSRRQTRHLD